jgi:hypothetical protein
VLHQGSGRRSHRGGSTSRTKGSVAMSPRRRHSKQLNSTWPAESALGVGTQRHGKRVDLSPRTPVLKDQFKLHELTRDICLDSTLPSPMINSPWPDDDSHYKEEPSLLPIPMRGCSRPDDDSHTEEEPSELHRTVSPWPDDHSHAGEEPSKKTPISTDL